MICLCHRSQRSQGFFCTTKKTRERPCCASNPMSDKAAGHDLCGFILELASTTYSKRSARARLKGNTKTQTLVRERRQTSKVMTRNGTGRLVTNQWTILPPSDRFMFEAMPRRFGEEYEVVNVNTHQQKTQKSLAESKEHSRAVSDTDGHEGHDELASVPPSTDIRAMEHAEAGCSPSTRQP